MTTEVSRGWARVLRIVGYREGGRILESLGVSPRAVEVLHRSVLHRVVHVGPLPSEAARTLRREMTRLGGEAALPEPAWESDGTTDLLLAGTLRVFDDLLRSMAVGEPEVRSIGDEIDPALQRDAAPPRQLRLRDTVIDLDHTLVMGVVDASDGAVEAARTMQKAGADLIGLRLAAESEEDEINRYVPAIGALTSAVDLPVGLETSSPEVARLAIGAGASMVSDVSDASDDRMAKLVAGEGVACVLVHAGGSTHTDETDLVSDVYRQLAERADRWRRNGVDDDRMLVDPGLGSRKSSYHNLVLLQRLGEFRSLGLPVVVGPHDASYVTVPSQAEPAPPVPTTVAWAVFQGARVVRVHDVGAAVDVVTMADAILAASA